MARTKTSTKREYKACFGDYKGAVRYEVYHPAHKETLLVAAPDEYAAMKAAGDYWGDNWLSYDFYPNCVVTKA